MSDDLFSKPTQTKFSSATVNATPSHTKTKSAPHEYQEARIKGLERQFNFSFSPWLYGLAMTVSEPVKVYAWMVQSKKYSVSWDAENKILNFKNIAGDKKRNYAEWALGRVKEYLGEEIFDHFGKISFAVNGEVQQ